MRKWYKDSLDRLDNQVQLYRIAAREKETSQENSKGGVLEMRLEPSGCFICTGVPWRCPRSPDTLPCEVCAVGMAEKPRRLWPCDWWTRFLAGPGFQGFSQAASIAMAQQKLIGLLSHKMRDAKQEAQMIQDANLANPQVLASASFSGSYGARRAVSSPGGVMCFSSTASPEQFPQTGNCVPAGLGRHAGSRNGRRCLQGAFSA